jgi:peptidoglycan/xylan/chitin deacetylase (PgdA/CDA1 family)
MYMFVHNSNFLIRSFFSEGFTWERPVQQNTIYLTFDDGPIPYITDWVLEILNKYEAKGTFFCVGDNIRKNREVYERVVNQGHATENHTFNHLSGWGNSIEKYQENARLCQEVLGKPVRLFRPPYGRITRKQADILREEGYEIVMWDVLSGDFEKSVSPETCLKKSIQYTKSGSITVFHDSIKAEKNLKYTLPRYIEHFAEKGYMFEKL